MQHREICRGSEKTYHSRVVEERSIALDQNGGVRQEDGRIGVVDKLVVAAKSDGSLIGDHGPLSLHGMVVVEDTAANHGKEKGKVKMRREVTWLNCPKTVLTQKIG